MLLLYVIKRQLRVIKHLLPSRLVFPQQHVELRVVELGEDFFVSLLRLRQHASELDQLIVLTNCDSAAVNFDQSCDALKLASISLLAVVQRDVPHQLVLFSSDLKLELAGVGTEAFQLGLQTC